MRNRDKRCYPVVASGIVLQPLSVVVLASLLSLGGCNSSSVTTTPDGGGGNGNTGGDPTVVTTLAADSADELIRHSLIGYYTTTGGGGPEVNLHNSVAEQSATADTAEGGAADGGTGGATRFSDTNVQEAGVDESDRIKIDGNIVFALEQPNSQYPGIFPVNAVLEDDVAFDSPVFPEPVETLSAYRLDKNNSSLLGRLTLDIGQHTPEGMYLHKSGAGSHLVMLSNQSFNNWQYWRSAPAWRGLNTRVSWIDIANPQALEIERSMDIDGQLISSRKIGNRLILVTRYYPQISGLIEYPASESDIDRNRDLIARADSSVLLPQYSSMVGTTRTSEPVIKDDRCYRSDAADASNDTDADLPSVYPNPSVISIITIDLDNQNTQVESTCFMGDSETIYVSQDALYLATTQYQYGFVTDDFSRPIADYIEPEITTDVHKFSFTSSGAAEFKGSGTVQGHLGWYPERKPFRMSEKDNNLRIVSFDQNRSGSPVTLTILAESGDSRLKTLSTLPNENRPKPIGKPGEKLYASRFIGDKAYLVTFRITDPLYVLDVANPMDPTIAGELELPGYSDYLHPVTDTLLVGLGKDAVADDGSGWGDGRGAWYQGVKLALFDVSDPMQPFVADSRIIGKRGTDSPALSQHHSFAWLAAGEGRNHRLAVPLELHNEELQSSSPSSWSDWTSNGLLTMEIDAAASSFVDVPNWTFESRAAGHQYSPVSLRHDRAVIGSDDGLYVIHNGGLQFGQWGQGAPQSATE